MVEDTKLKWLAAWYVLRNTVVIPLTIVCFIAGLFWLVVTFRLVEVAVVVVISIMATCAFYCLWENTYEELKQNERIYDDLRKERKKKRCF